MSGEEADSAAAAGAAQQAGWRESAIMRVKEYPSLNLLELAELAENNASFRPFGKWICTANARQSEEHAAH
jgi:hypothetical protein